MGDIDWSFWIGIVLIVTISALYIAKTILEGKERIEIARFNAKIQAIEQDEQKEPPNG